MVAVGAGRAGRGLGVDRQVLVALAQAGVAGDKLGA